MKTLSAVIRSSTQQLPGEATPTMSRAEADAIRAQVRSDKKVDRTESALVTKLLQDGFTPAKASLSFEEGANKLLSDLLPLSVARKAVEAGINTLVAKAPQPNPGQPYKAIVANDVEGIISRFFGPIDSLSAKQVSAAQHACEGLTETAIQSLRPELQTLSARLAARSAQLEVGALLERAPQAGAYKAFSADEVEQILEKNFDQVELMTPTQARAAAGVLDGLAESANQGNRPALQALAERVAASAAR